jgi:hypothetical protein
MLAGKGTRQTPPVSTSLHLQRSEMTFGLNVFTALYLGSIYTMTLILSGKNHKMYKKGYAEIQHMPKNENFSLAFLHYVKHLGRRLGD